ncbi:MAG: hypothetical protein BroJett011_41610 [Chloroflexota bacterium]|nr:MAG: hypothetical protein BroJett011_41610 [Chloroflexota bacterium]
MYIDRIVEKYSTLNKYHARQLFLTLLVMAGLALTVNRLETFVIAERNYLPLGDVEVATQALKAHDPDLKSKIVMAIDPGRAYYAGSKFLITPLDYEGPLEAMVSYNGVSEQLKNYAPKYPSTMTGSDLKADYLIYTASSENWMGGYELPQFSFLLYPISDKIPNNFEIIYQSSNVVVYEINKVEKTYQH